MILAEGFDWGGLTALLVAVLTCLGGVATGLLKLYWDKRKEAMAFARSLERANGKGGEVETHLNAEMASDPRIGDKLKKTRALARKQVEDEG